VIKLDRNLVKDPIAADTKLGILAAEELKRAEEFFSNQDYQKRFRFKVYANADVKQALRVVCHDKCAYCESLVGVTSHGDIEHYRPKTTVADSKGHPGYWWLASDWNNLLLVCQFCNRQSRGDLDNKIGKGSRFPLENENFRAFAPGEENHEAPLILNPFIDDPLDHLIYDSDGTLHGTTERGRVTITILALNRKHIISQRLERKRLFDHILNSVKIDKSGKFDPDDIRKLQELAAPDKAYAGFMRHLISEAGEQFADSMDNEIGFENFQNPKNHNYKNELDIAKKSQLKFETEMSDYSMEEDEGIEKYKFQKRTIEYFHIENIKGISKVTFDPSENLKPSQNWLVFLGENGAGKSTILQSLAIILSGAENFSDLLQNGFLDIDHLIRYGSNIGKIEVRLSGFKKPFRLHFENGIATYRDALSLETKVISDGKIIGDSWRPQTLLLAYGSVRLLPRNSSHRNQPHKNIVVKTKNLFDPFVPLIDANDWLSNLEVIQFNQVALIIKDLLALDLEAEFIRKNDEVYVKIHSNEVPLKHMSDGYQSVIALVVDTLHLLMKIWENPETAEGVVIIDELGSHLHPRWQMQIIRSFKRSLPNVQFLASTHHPLCLKGLDDGEVILLKKTEEGDSYMETNLPSPSAMRVDQILTSQFFGLNSTIDPEVEAKFDQYYALLALTRRTKKQKVDLENLKDELKDLEHFGYTKREELIHRSVDKIIADDERNLKESSIVDIPDEIMIEVKSLWEDV